MRSSLPKTEKFGKPVNYYRGVTTLTDLGENLPQPSRAIFQESFHSQLKLRTASNDSLAIRKIFYSAASMTLKGTVRPGPRKAEYICSAKSCHITSPWKSLYPQCVMTHECLLSVVMQSETVVCVCRQPCSRALRQAVNKKREGYHKTNIQNTTSETKVF